MQDITLGNSVAEFDNNLEKYFVTTAPFNEIIRDRWDIIRGTKGSGKSALLLGMLRRQKDFTELNNVILATAINHNGDPVFRGEFYNIEPPITEAKLINAWKIYFLNIAWVQIKEHCWDINEIEKLLIHHKLIISEPGLLYKVRFAIARVFKPKELKISYTDPCGPTYSGEMVLVDPEKEPAELVDFNLIYQLLDQKFKENNIRLWILLDRLDDAFPGNPELEITALRSLLMAYKDIAGYTNLKLKIFIRDDIYDSITRLDEGFRSLTHVNANAMDPITWNDEKLLHLLFERLLFNESFVKYLIDLEYDPNTIENHDDREVALLNIFRDQVDTGPKSPKTFRWILNHIKDGKGTITPRDLITLVEKARQIQIEQWSVNGVHMEDDYLIGPSSLKSAWNHVSREKLETQLYAEYPKLMDNIKVFKGGKAEHNETTLKQLLGEKWEQVVEELEFVGFIERLSQTWKIPFIYREGLQVSQGKAFSYDYSLVEEEE